jgi:nitrate reductase gamma subunit
MENPLSFVDQLLFAVLPYVAVVAFLVLLAARRYRVPPFGPPRQPPTLLGEPRHYGERLLFGYGILVILGGHVLAFLIPEQVSLWNNDPARLYVLEVSALVFALMTLTGLFLTVARCAFDPAARRGVGPADWALHVLLLVQVGSGVYVALFYWPGSSWFASSTVPYLRSLVRLEPDLSSISAMPDPVKLHFLAAWVLVVLLPFTRVVHPLIGREPDEVTERVPSRVTTALLLVGLGFSGLALIPRLWGAPLPGNHRGYEPVQPLAFSHRLHAGELQMACLYCHADAEKGRHAGIAAASVCQNCHRFITAPLRNVRADFELAQREKQALPAVVGASTVGLLGTPSGQGPLLAASVLIPGRTEQRPSRMVISPELAKLYAALGLDDKLQPDPARTPTPIRWVKVHNLPSFVHFDHRAHVSAGVTCQTCHGPVETMERVRQVEDLSMGWCVQCHRDANQNGVEGKLVHASNDCATCHH